MRHLRLAIVAGHPGAGASTVSLQLSLALARRLSEPVVLVDANSRRPSLHTALGLDRQPGLTDMAEGDLAVDKIASHSSRHPNLSFLTAGSPVGSPLRFFESVEFEEIFAVLDGCYRAIVFDCPVLGRDPECESLLERVGNAVVVLEADNTRWEVAQRMKYLLEAAHTQIAGVILNRKRRYIPNAIYRLL
jgi:Mrp family chromosome partitioning ATPase